MSSLHLPRRSALIEWSAAAIVAAALYLAIPAVTGAVVGTTGWAWLVLAAVTTVLVLYAHRTGAPLRVLAIVVLLGVSEFIAELGTAIGERCGDSRLAGDLELVGTIAIPLALGSWAVRRHRVWPLPVAIVAAALWAVVVAHVIPGGAGACFD